MLSREGYKEWANTGCIILSLLHQGLWMKRGMPAPPSIEEANRFLIYLEQKRPKWYTTEGVVFSNPQEIVKSISDFLLWPMVYSPNSKQGVLYLRVPQSPHAVSGRYYSNGQFGVVYNPYHEDRLNSIALSNYIKGIHSKSFIGFDGVHGRIASVALRSGYATQIRLAKEGFDSYKELYHENASS